MNNPVLPAADVATRVKIVAVAAAATIVAGLVATHAQPRSGSLDPHARTTSHTVLGN
jgi:hypothetical protein